MSLLSEIGTVTKTEMAKLDKIILSAKSSLETSVGKKMDNIEFKTISDKSIKGSGNIDINELTGGAGTLLKSHTGAFTNLKLDWNDISEKYAFIKIFFYIPDGRGISRFRLIDGRGCCCAYYCTSGWTCSGNGNCCVSAGDTETYYSYLNNCNGNYSCCHVTHELTIGNNIDTSCISFFNKTTGSYAPNGGDYSSIGATAGVGICVCCGVGGICLDSSSGDAFKGDVRITVVGFMPQ